MLIKCLLQGDGLSRVATHLDALQGSAGAVVHVAARQEGQPHIAGQRMEAIRRRRSLG